MVAEISVSLNSITEAIFTSTYKYLQNRQNKKTKKMQETAKQRFIMQFTTAIKMSPKQCHWLVAWRAHRWSIFPVERECVVAHLMLLVFFELKSLRRCVLFHLLWLIARVYVSACMYAFMCVWEIERIIVCFRLRGSSCLFCSVFSNRRLCDRDWEKLCLGAVGGLMLAGLMYPFKTTFLQRHNTWMTSISPVQKRWRKDIKNIFFCL